MPRTDQSEMRLRGERGERDAVGEAMAQAMIASHPAVQRLRPEAHDWNDQLKARAGSAGRPAAPELSPAELLLLGKKNHESPVDTGAGIDARVALPQSSILPNAERF